MCVFGLILLECLLSNYVVSLCILLINILRSCLQKACLEEGKLLLLSQDWNLLILYVLSAWKYVHGLPDWDDASHNAIKKQCFQTLAAQCMVAIKRKPFDSSSLEDLRKRLAMKYFGDRVFINRILNRLQYDFILIID